MNDISTRIRALDISVDSLFDEIEKIARYKAGKEKTAVEQFALNRVHGAVQKASKWFNVLGRTRLDGFRGSNIVKRVQSTRVAELGHPAPHFPTRPVDSGVKGLHRRLAGVRERIEDALEPKYASASVVEAVRFMQKFARKAHSNYEEEQDVKRQRLQGSALTSAGAYAAYKSKPLITGRTRLFHGTTEEAAGKIRKEGLKPRSVTKIRGITGVTAPEVDEASKNLAFATKSPTEARIYASQSEKMKHQFNAMDRADPLSVNRAVNDLRRLQETQQYDLNLRNPFNRKGIVKVDVPLWRRDVATKLRRNPEAHGSFAEFRAKAPQPLIDIRNPMDKYLEDLGTYRSLNNSKAFEGGLGPEFIRGSKNFIPLSAKEIGQYARTRPGRFAAGVGLTAGGVALAGLGAKRFISAKRSNHSEKQASLAPSLGAVLQSPFTIKSQKIKGPDEKPQGRGMLKFSKNSPWLRKQGSDNESNKAKIIGGLAAATAAGVGAKLLHSHWKGKTLPKTISRHAHAIAEAASKPHERKANGLGRTRAKKQDEGGGHPRPREAAR